MAEKWMEVAGESPEMASRALYTRDQVEEELSRVAFEMDVRGWARDAVEAPEGTVRASALSDALIAAYCVLREVPAELVGEKRQRYATMGALLAAQNLAVGEPRAEAVEDHGRRR